MTGLPLALITVVIAVGGIGMAQAQGVTPPAPTGLVAVNGPNPGEALLSWNAVADAAFYRIGWVAFPDYEATVAAGRDWLEAFHFLDAVNTGQTQWILTRLSPGVEYYFIIASNDARNGPPQYGEWSELLTLNDDTSSCPTAAPEPEPTPIPQPTPAPTRGPVADGDYDADDDGLIEVSSLAQLNAMRWDLNGDGSTSNPGYAQAFPSAAPDMGCPREGCIGYELSANLDFDTNGSGDADAGDAYWNGGDGWFPIGGGGGGFPTGDNDLIFNATFDGNGYTISNLYIYRPALDNVGLIGALGEHNKVVNIGLADVNVSGAGFVGGLIGYSYASNIIANSNVTGTVSGDYYIGGLIGINFITNNKVVDCHSHSIVSGRDRSVGGLIGRSGGRITGSYATGNVFGAGASDVGGLVGYNSSDIVASYATGNVFGTHRIGGLAGASATAIITDAYATGNVQGISAGDVQGAEDVLVGGLVGSNFAIINNSYAIGRVSGDGDMGGLVGHNEGAIAASYWDVRTTGQPAEENGDAGQTTRALQAPTSATGIYANWNPSWVGLWHISPVPGAEIRPPGPGGAAVGKQIESARMNEGTLGTLWAEAMPSLFCSAAAIRTASKRWVIMTMA